MEDLANHMNLKYHVVKNTHDWNTGQILLHLCFTETYWQYYDGYNDGNTMIIWVQNG